MHMLTRVVAVRQADGIVSPDTSSASFAIDGCPSAPGTTVLSPQPVHTINALVSEH